MLDLFGFQGQLVFATFAGAMYRGKDVERLYAGASAQNKAMANFCAADQRLLPVDSLVDLARRRTLGCNRQCSRVRAISDDKEDSGQARKSAPHPPIAPARDLYRICEHILYE